VFEDIWWSLQTQMHSFVKAALEEAARRAEAINFVPKYTNNEYLPKTGKSIHYMFAVSSVSSNAWKDPRQAI
jgi:hypothetical protein